VCTHCGVNLGNAEDRLYQWTGKRGRLGTASLTRVDQVENTTTRGWEAEKKKGESLQTLQGPIISGPLFRKIRGDDPGTGVQATGSSRVRRRKRRGRARKMRHPSGRGGDC